MTQRAVIQANRELDTTESKGIKKGTHKTANFRGWNIRTGKMMKHMQIEKQTSAPMLQPAKINIRSHRVTVQQR